MAMVEAIRGRGVSSRQSHEARDTEIEWRWLAVVSGVVSLIVGQ